MRQERNLTPLCSRKIQVQIYLSDNNTKEEDMSNTATSHPAGFEQIDPTLRVLENILK